MHGLTCMLLLLHSALKLSVVKMLLKREVGGRALKSHGNYIVDHGKSWKNHGIVFLKSCWNPVIILTKYKGICVVYVQLKGILNGRICNMSLPLFYKTNYTLFKHTLCDVFVTILMSSCYFLLSYHFGPILKRT